jgi:hypothetical protein
MDIGVGSFIFSSALVSQKARESLIHSDNVNPNSKTTQSKRIRNNINLSNRINTLLNTLRSSALLLFVGLTRFAVVKLFNYQVSLIPNREE